MRGVYTAEYEISSLTGTRTVLSLYAPSSAVLEILSASITNANNDNSEQYEAGIYYMTSSTGNYNSGTAVVPRHHERNDIASAVQSFGDYTAEPAYTGVAVDHQGFNNLAGYRYDPIPEERPIVPPSSGIGLRLLANPVSGFNAVAQIVYREIG